MIISLRGTNGSGKSTVIREVMAAGRTSEIWGVLGHRNPEAYQILIPGVKQPLFVLGPYNVECGGCDRIIPYDLIIELIDKYAARGNVIFEGVIVSSVFGRVGEQLERYKDRAVVAFMPTSLEECIRRVTSRRTGRGDERAFNPQNLTSKYKAVSRIREGMIRKDVLRVVTLPQGGEAAALLELLRENGRRSTKSASALGSRARSDTQAKRGRRAASVD